MAHAPRNTAYDPTLALEIACDLCGRRDAEHLGISGDGLARAVICRRCGLIYLSPRMGQEWYAHFYQEAYRERAGELADLGRIFSKGRAHGRALAAELTAHLPPAGLLIEVGSSAGGVLSGVRDALPGLAVLGIEPSVREAAYARERGIPTRVAMVEDIAARGVSIPPAEVILSAQSLNHFLSPRAFFAWTWRAMKPAGRLVIEVKNFRQQVRRSGRLANSIQIDHLYMFTPETLRQYLAAAGFRTLALGHDEGLSLQAISERRARGLPGYQILAVAEKASGEPFAAVESALGPGAYVAVRASLAPWRVFFHHYLRYRSWHELIPR